MTEEISARPEKRNLRESVDMMKLRPQSGWASALLLLAALAWVTPSAAADKSTKQKSNPPADTSKYVGSDTCKTCHEDLYNAWAKTPHWKTTEDTHGGPSKQGCEGCHGPGADHVAGGGDKSKIFIFKDHSRQEASERCLTCHGDSHAQSHFSQSAHASSEVGCLDCHSPHHAKAEQHLLVKGQPELCYGCHSTEKADFSKPFHHRVEEGLVTCSDCHNPHGAATVRQLQTLASGDAVCYKCHAEKQGPYVYEHTPVKTEGCSSCHSPHGSTNARLLKVSVVTCSACSATPFRA